MLIQKTLKLKLLTLNSKHKGAMATHSVAIAVHTAKIYDGEHSHCPFRA